MTETYAYVNMILLACMAAMFTVIVAVASWWARSITGKLADLDTLNNGQSAALVKFEAWAEAHDKQDDDRHDDTRARLDRNHESVHDLRNSLSELGIKAKLRERLTKEEPL